MESKLIKELMDKGVLISPELINANIDEAILKDIINHFKDDLDVLDMDIIKEFSVKKQKEEEEPKVKILKSYDGLPKKRTFQDFVSFFNL